MYNKHDNMPTLLFSFYHPLSLWTLGAQVTWGFHKRRSFAFFFPAVAHVSHLLLNVLSVVFLHVCCISPYTHNIHWTKWKLRVTLLKCYQHLSFSPNQNSRFLPCEMSIILRKHGLTWRFRHGFARFRQESWLKNP